MKHKIDWKKHDRLTAVRRPIDGLQKKYRTKTRTPGHTRKYFWCYHSQKPPDDDERGNAIKVNEKKRERKKKKKSAEMEEMQEIVRYRVRGHGKKRGKPKK